MIVIKTLEGLRCLKRSKVLPVSYINFVEESFLRLFDLFIDREYETEEEFSLDHFGYIVILQSCDDVRDLSVVGLNREEQGLLSGVDSVDKVELDNVAMYVIQVVYNDSFLMTFLSEVGIHDDEIEKWLASECVNHI